MNKFAAMLRDSFREAIDGWVFPVMLALIALVVVLVGSISYEPLPVEEAIPKMLRGQAMQMVHPDRGLATRMAMFLYQVKVVEPAAVTSADRPWESEVRFALEYTSAGFGPAGVEIDDTNDPKSAKQVEPSGGLLASAFQEAVRYWAAKPGEKPRPEYSDALAAEFVAAQVRDVGRLHVTAITPEPQAGGLLGFAKPNAHKFIVTAAGGERLGWAHRPGLFFGLWEISLLERPLGDLVHLIEDTLVHGLGAWVILLAGVVVTAGFIPDMLRKGAIDLLLTKPMSRPLILLYKYLGGLTFVSLLTSFAVGGVWLAIGTRSGVWAPGLLYSIPAITFYFAVLYACSTLVGVLTRNAIVSIVITIVFWFAVWLIGTVNGTLTVIANLETTEPTITRPMTDEKAETPTGDPKPAFDVPQWVVRSFRLLNAITPRTKDLDDLTSTLIGRQLLSPAGQRQAGMNREDLNWAPVLGVAAAYIAGFMGLATARFITRSY